MTRYSRDEAEQVIRDAAEHIGAVEAVARALHALAASGHDTGSEAARLHAELDRNLDWFSTRNLRLDGLHPVSVAVPARLVDGDGSVDVWLSWCDGDDGITHFYPLDADVHARVLLPPDATL